jgi:drug/metabolite transporter (DMT)-like permease
MEQWLIMGIIAAVFISIRDIMSYNLFKRYDYLDYIVFANIVVFGFTILYLLFAKRKIVPPERNDIFLVMLRIVIIYLIITPAAYYCIKNCKNLGHAKTVINLNSAFLIIFSIFLMKQEINMIQTFGLGLIILGSYIIATK